MNTASRRTVALGCCVAIALAIVWIAWPARSKPEVEEIADSSHEVASSHDSVAPEERRNESERNEQRFVPNRSKLPEYAAARIAFEAEAQEIELRSISVVWDKHLERHRLSVLAIKAPSQDQIGELSEAFSAAISTLPPELQNAARIDLRNVYGSYAQFRMPYKILYVRRLNSSADTRVETSEVANLDEALPTDAGLVTYRNHYTLDAIRGWWKPRYERALSKLPE